MYGQLNGGFVSGFSRCQFAVALQQCFPSSSSDTLQSSSVAPVSQTEDTAGRGLSWCLEVPWWLCGFPFPQKSTSSSWWVSPVTVLTYSTVFSTSPAPCDCMRHFSSSMKMVSLEGTNPSMLTQTWLHTAIHLYWLLNAACVAT